MEKEEAYFGLPKEVKFCKRCVMSNQRPDSTIENKYTINSKKETICFDDEGICDACQYFKVKKEIDWKKREEELWKLCDEYRKNDGSYDCIVPGSGGKDSCFAAHILKHKFKMHPLTITWAPHIYTTIGRENFQNWIYQGFDNILVTPNGRIHKLLTKLAFKNLGHPFQPFIIGQKCLAPKLALKFNIPLIFYGESPAEYGMKKELNESPIMNPAVYSYDTPDLDLSNIFFGGISAKDLIEKYGLNLNDIQIWLPSKRLELEKIGVQFRFLGYYINWDPQENYYYAVEKCNFKANPTRRDGTYCKYSSVDDKIDDLHYYTTFIKFGIGKATYDAAQEIRCKKITREEGVALVKKFDGEFPSTFHKEVLEYLNIDEKEFEETIDKFRSPHLWKKEEGRWILKHAVWHEENKGEIKEGSGEYLKVEQNIGYLKKSNFKENGR